jgi:8-oxo-dGTP pyrophosphatase MutT (NUDIX family)
MGGISVDEGFWFSGGAPLRTGSLTRVAANPPDGANSADANDYTERAALRQAATVMLVRDAAEPDSDGSSLEVLMVRRNLNSDFVGGAFVFPGGSVDPLDGGAEAEAACRDRSDAEASTLLGIHSGGLAYWVAALRETFEEAGLLLAERPDGPPLLAGEPEEEARFVAERAAVNAGTRRFLDLCRDERLLLRVGDVHYFAHWIAPRGAPKRFDTRFFVAAAPPGQKAAHDAGEMIAETWISPHRALEGHRDGVFELIFPTIRNLQAISRFPTSGALLEAAERASGSVPTIEPRVVADGNGVRILLPGDDGYEDDRAAPPPRGPADFNEAIRTISRAANQEGGPTDGGVAVPRRSARPEG